ncbi:hypothetical protein DV736_g5837, partial [Chaetothyriales sp. CBS 134916]
MPPKRIPIAPASRRSPTPKGYISGAYHALTSEDNRSVVVSVGLFALIVFYLQAAVAFFSSEWSEILLPGV